MNIRICMPMLRLSAVMILFFLPLQVLAAKTVPTIRIEIPSAQPQADEARPHLPLNDEEAEEPAEEEGANTGQQEQATVPSAPAVIYYGTDALPDVVKATRDRLLEAAHSGDVEQLRPIFQSFKTAPILSFDDHSDPIDFLKTSSGDGEGREILAILIEILESGYVRRDEGEDPDVYVWPYFVSVPPQALTPRQLVELFRIITAGDYEDMKSYGTYIFYRVGITPNGEMKFFLAGE